MKFTSLMFILLWLLPSISFSATEYATFDSFYKESTSVDWVIALFAALIVGALIFFTSGTASPIVASIGTWIGGTMGLSGAAATNAGLALLGGGSIASGGFGILGGTAVLTAALTFGTEIAFEYTLDTAINKYEYRELVDKSKKMLTLPLPVNRTGPDAYESAINILDDYNREEPIFYHSNQDLIERAIKAIESDTKKMDEDEFSKNKSLLSLLYFVTNDYAMARKQADKAVQLARYSGIRRTLPAFIYATSTLYEEKFDFVSVTSNYFRYSVLAEPNNPFIPLLFSIYLERMQLRFNDDYLDESAFFQIFNIMKTDSIESFRQTNYGIILSKYFMRLWLEQQNIEAIVNTSSDTIKHSTNSLMVLDDSLTSYTRLLKDSIFIINSLLDLELDEEGRIKASELSGLWAQYSQDKSRLMSLIVDFKAQQVQPQYIENRYIYIALVLILVMGIFLAIRKFIQASRSF